jgi:outer membrane protein assembly factor BamB
MNLDAAMYAQPIVAGGVVLAATENNSVYAIDVATGHLRWRMQLETPARRSDLPCGNIDPSGITGTPAYDAATRTVFVVTEGTDARHTLRALDVANGQQRWQRNVDVAPGRDPLAEQERAALLVASGHVYVAFGGRDGDCGNYVGYVAAVATTGTGTVARYAVPTAREAGMWAAAGPVVGPGGDVYVASGNGAEGGGSYDGSDSVIRLSTDMQRKAFFAPGSWRDDNAQDLDLGSMSPVPVDGKVVIAGKRGTVYLLSPDLGGIGGELGHLDGCAGFGGAAVTGTTVVMPCNGGVRALQVQGNRMRWLWQRDGVTGSPAIGGDAAYAFDNGDLVELSLSNGRTLTRTHVGDVTRFATPAPVGQFVLVGTKSGLVAIVGAT